MPNATPPENWLPVVGYEGYYEVSDLGSVRSLPRILTDGRTFKGRVLKPQTLNFGHQSVTLSRGNVARRHLVHRLLLTAFDRQPEPHEDARHLNGVPADNRLINLAWGTRGENCRDTVKHGKHPFATRLVCPQGHALIEPNLERWTFSRGSRKCLSCTRARAKLQKAPALPGGLQGVSDTIYRSLMPTH